jgi:fermentation-respiration switch protein FrsA (DUF1100 family)
MESAVLQPTRLAVAVRSERAWFLLGTSVAAVHVLDDSFLQPEPGTSAGDHLVSGLVPLALIGIAAAAYSHLRAGARAMIAVAFGLLTVVAGAGEAGYYALEIGPARDDYTGLLSIPAGVLLVGVGAVTLWRTRRLDDRRLRRYARRALLFILAVLGAYQFIALASAYVMTHSARAAVPEAALGTGYENVVFPAADGHRLAGWYIPSKNHAAVIAFPGRKGPQAHARMLARHGYGVLLFDRSGEGASEGDPDGLGWAGDGDVLAAIAFLRTRADVDPARIGALGLSTGGEVVLQTAAASDGLSAVVSEGAGIRSIREELELSGDAKWAFLPQWALTTAATAIFAGESPPPNLKDLVGRIAPRPILLIYAENGQGGEDLNAKFFAAAGEPKELWEVPGAQHLGGITTHPQEYERRVIDFFDSALVKGGAK